MNFSSIKNIVFDLGGVVINIDFQLTFDAFARATNKSSEFVKEKFLEGKVFERYEVGAVSDKEFRIIVRELLETNLSDEAIDKAWNALLLDIPLERVELIRKLRNKYKVYLLSNTNKIHIDGVNKILYDTSGVEDLEHLFDKVYYSWKILLSKPSVESYQEVLRDAGLAGEETLFLDDNLDNVEGARKAGIHALQVKASETIIELLKNA